MTATATRPRPQPFPGRDAGSVRIFDDLAASPRLASVKGVEIFAAGTHRGITYSEADLDQMVSNFQALAETIKPPVVIGHEEQQQLLDNTGIPACGRVVKVWRDGPTLFADFDEVPLAVAKLINARAYKTVSSEVYDDFVDEATGTHHGKALRRVALLGGELPQIKTLADLPWADYFEQPQSHHRRALLAFREVREGPDRNTYRVFCEVTEMAKKAKPAPAKNPKHKPLDTHRKAWQAFADEPPTTDAAAPAPGGVGRADLTGMLGQWGFDTSLLDSLPDEVAMPIMAEMVRVYQSMEAPAAEAKEPPPMPQPGGMMAATPPIQQPAPQPAPAPAPVSNGMPNGQPSKVILQYSENGKEVTMDLTTFLTGTITPMRDQLTAAQKDIDAFQADTRKSRIDAFCERMVKEGKLLPAEIDAGIKDRLARANAVQKFSDGLTELDKQMAEIEARPVLVKFSEHVKSGKRAGGGTNGDDEINKVTRFAEENQSFAQALKAVGDTPQSYVAKFKRAREKNPHLTAAEYGVAPEYCN